MTITTMVTMTTTATTTTTTTTTTKILWTMFMVLSSEHIHCKMSSSHPPDKCKEVPRGCQPRFIGQMLLLIPL